MTDRLLDFLIMFIPTVKIAPIVGVQDNIKYRIYGIDLSGFKLRKDSVSVRLGNFATDGELIHVTAFNLSAVIQSLRWECTQLNFPYLRGDGTANATVQGGRVDLSIGLEKIVVSGKCLICMIYPRISPIFLLS